MNKSALIGYTGFIGSNLATQYEFTNLYNSKNIKKIKSKSFDIVFSSANSGYKWKVNLNPEADRKNIESYIDIIKTIKTKKFVLISSIDVYPYPHIVNEDTRIISNDVLPYGENRLMMEHFVEANFSDFLIIRVPIIYGPNFKKNVIYDLMYNHEVSKINPNSKLQIYNANNLRKHIDIALENNLKYLNLAVEPVWITEIAKNIFGHDIINNHSPTQFMYDMRTNYDYLFSKKNTGYIQTKAEVLNEIISFKNSIKP